MNLRLFDREFSTESKFCWANSLVSSLVFTVSKMTDVVSKLKRSQMMSGIKGKNTGPEMQVRRFLHSSGFRYRLHRKDLPGAPDIVLTRYRVAIFVHGCFWHRHPGCKYASTPATRQEFWLAKLDGNRLRDNRDQASLLGMEWRVAVIWECALRHSPQIALQDLKRFIQSSRKFQEYSLSQRASTE